MFERTSPSARLCNRQRTTLSLLADTFRMILASDALDGSDGDEDGVESDYGTSVSCPFVKASAPYTRVSELDRLSLFRIQVYKLKSLSTY